MTDELEDLRAQVKAYQDAPSFRFCLVPPCLRQFDMIAWQDSRIPLQRPEWSGEGWRQVRPAVPLKSDWVCPDHADLVTAHMPRHILTDDARPYIVVNCTCGDWTSPLSLWHGAVRGLWEQHLLTASGLLSDTTEDTEGSTPP